MSRLLILEGDGDKAFFAQLMEVHEVDGFDIYERPQRTNEGLKDDFGVELEQVEIASGTGAFATILEAQKTTRNFIVVPA